MRKTSLQYIVKELGGNDNGTENKIYMQFLILWTENNTKV